MKRVSFVWDSGISRGPVVIAWEWDTFIGISKF